MEISETSGITVEVIATEYPEIRDNSDGTCTVKINPKIEDDGNFEVIFGTKIYSYKTKED